MENISIVIFDLGGVIFKTSFDAIFNFWAQSLMVPEDYIRNKFLRDDAYRDFSCGRISSKQYFYHIRDRLDLPLDWQNFKVGWQRFVLGKIDGIEESIQILRNKNIPCFILSNTNPIHMNYVMMIYGELLSFFDSIFVSYKIGLRKPDPGIYSYMLANLDVPTSQVLYFDDKIENVETAAHFGVQAVCFDQKKWTPSLLSQHIQ